MIIESLKPLAVPIDSVREDSHNARLHPEQNLETIKKSLSHYGQRKPIVVNQDGIIEAGNGLWKAAKQLGWTEIAVARVEDTPEEATAFAIMDNQSALLAEWDFPQLKDQLQELDTGTFDMDLTGFNKEAIEDLMTQLHQLEEGLTDDDAIPEEVETVCKAGDLWKLGNHRLLCGDATVREDLEKLMGGEKADVGITDPPYGVRKKEEWDNKDLFIASIKDWFNSFRIATKEGLIWFCADKMLPALVTIEGFKRLLIWNKPAGSQFAGASNNNLWYSSEPILVYDYAEIEKNCGTKDYSYSVFESRTIPKVKEGHPTTKPVDLMSWLIDHYSKIGQSVLDLFGGSGSTLIACEKLDRRCFMMEIDEHYCDVIIKRWEDFTGKKAVGIDA